MKGKIGLLTAEAKSGEHGFDWRCVVGLAMAALMAQEAFATIGTACKSGDNCSPTTATPPVPPSTLQRVVITGSITPAPPTPVTFSASYVGGGFLGIGVGGGGGGGGLKQQTPQPILEPAKGETPAEGNREAGCSGASLSEGPVNLANGEKYLEEPDFMPGGIYPLNHTRHYHSKSGSGTLFGPKWISSFDYPRIVYAGGRRTADALALKVCPKHARAMVSVQAFLPTRTST